MSDPSTVCDGGALPAPTQAELARGFEDAYRAASMGNFSSWTDGDLYRAIETEPEGPGHGPAVAEYVGELRRRDAERAEAAAREARLRAKYQL